jgi:hypothetical protein
MKCKGWRAGNQFIYGLVPGKGGTAGCRMELVCGLKIANQTTVRLVIFRLVLKKAPIVARNSWVMLCMSMHQWVNQGHSHADIQYRQQR